MGWQGSGARDPRAEPRPEFQGPRRFVEDYDMDLARDLVQGCDVWLNQPVRPQEASGTSGMKAAANGVLNVRRAGRLVGRGLRVPHWLGHWPGG